MITGLYAGILSLMLVGLIIRIAVRRLKYRVGLGDGGISDLGQAIRVHGNFTEIVPITVILMGLMEYNGIAPWLLHLYGMLLVLARILHAYGITQSPLQSFGRKNGIIANMLLLVAGSLILVYNFISLTLSD